LTVNALRVEILPLVFVLGWLVSPAAQTNSTKAFSGVRLIDGTGAPAIDNAVIPVRDGRLTAVGSAARVTVPADAARTSLAGKTVIPGLINTHGHVGDTDRLDAERYSAANVTRDLRLYSKYGVTAVFSLGGDQAPAFAVASGARLRRALR
jgi:imidazolonepropionase-like amidohydrolase